VLNKCEIEKKEASQTSSEGSVEESKFNYKKRLVVNLEEMGK